MGANKFGTHYRIGQRQRNDFLSATELEAPAAALVPQILATRTQCGNTGSLDEGYFIFHTTGAEVQVVCSNCGLIVNLTSKEV